MPPKVEGIDDLTGEPLIQRDDDKEEIVTKRITFYHKVNDPIIKYYETQKVLHKVDGNNGIDETWKKVEYELKASGAIA